VIGSNQQLLYLGSTRSRTAQPFGIRRTDRLSHIHLIGKTGVGKTTLLESLAVQDMEAMRGFALIDPHGDAYQTLSCLRKTTPSIIHFDPLDPATGFGFNPVRRVRPDLIPLASSGFLDALRKLWSDAWGVRMEHVLRCCLYTLLERSGSTLPDILRLFTDEPFRKAITRSVRNPIVRTFW
jgi:hypothetical protein